MTTTEPKMAEEMISKLTALKHTNRPDITNLVQLERNFGATSDTSNRVRQTISEFQRLVGKIINVEVFVGARALPFAERTSTGSWNHL